MTSRGQTAEFPDPPRDWYDWRAFLDSRIVASIPSRSAEVELDRDTHVTRDLADWNWTRHLDVEDPPYWHKWPRIVLYADTFCNGRIGVSMSPDTRRVFLIGRQLTLDSGTNIISHNKTEAVTFDIWTAKQDFNIKFETGHAVEGGSHWKGVRVGLQTGKVGARVTFGPKDPGDTPVEYFDRFPSDLAIFPMIDAHLQAELRLATALSWTHPNMAMSIFAYVARWTANNAEYALMNGQAAALGQQLATVRMMEENVTYVPELQVDEYVDDTRERIEVVTAFSDQYERFVDKQASLEDQLAAWDVMLEKAKGEKKSQEQRRDRALDRYNSASEVAGKCQTQFLADDQALKDAQQAFEEGVEEWKQQQMLNIFAALFEFILGLAELCFGDVGGMSSVGKAVDTLGEVGDVAGKMLSVDTLQNLGDCMHAIATISANLDKLVEGAMGFADGSTSLPPIDNISGSGSGDADAMAILTMGEWDKWILQSDQQVEFAVGENIRNASEYRLALRKHGVNGKTLAQAHAHAVKAGQEFVQLQMELVALENDVKHLEQLEEHYHQEAEAYEEAALRFYDRQTTLKVGVWMDLKKAAAAYRYYSLKDFRLALGPLVPVEELMSQLQQITGAIREADENWDKDFQTFEYRSSSELLPSTDHQSIVRGLQDKATRKATFTLTPIAKTGNSLGKTNSQGLPADFHDGFHWRTWGMDPILRGAVPRPEKLVNGHVTVNLWITTGGMFSDVDETGNIQHFSAGPQKKLCAYELYDSGNVCMTTSAIYPATKHMDRTPFTQWTVALEEESYEALNLDGLEGLDMHWKGNYMPIELARRDSGFALS